MGKLKRKTKKVKKYQEAGPRKVHLSATYSPAGSSGGRVSDKFVTGERKEVEYTHSGQQRMGSGAEIAPEDLYDTEKERFTKSKTRLTRKGELKTKHKTISAKKYQRQLKRRKKKFTTTSMEQYKSGGFLSKPSVANLDND